MLIEVVNTQSYEDFDNHEQVWRCTDEATGLHALIAIHNRNLGPALGGCRMRPYNSEAEAITDVLRLSKGMTYKSALASLPLGGGKAVIIGDPKTGKSDAMLHAMGQFIDSLKGMYISAEDSGTSVADLRVMHLETEYVAGIHERKLSNGRTADGDPSPSTAYGVYKGIRASLQQRFRSDSLDGVRVAVQGVGNVGRNLVKLLVADGAKVFISDAYEPAIARVLKEHDVQVVANAKIQQLDVEVFAPCALGGVLSTKSLVELTAPIVAGAANNQLSNDGAGQYLFHKGILYAPDFVINAGGIIDIFYERQGYDHAKVLAHIDKIQETLLEIFAYSVEHQVPTHITAERLGDARFLGVDISDVA